MNVLSNLVIAGSLIFASLANANVILSLDPSTQLSTKGEPVSVTVMIDGLGDFVPLSLSSFDFDIEFDSSILSFTGYSLFDSLGDLAALDADDFSFAEYVPGVVNISEFSYLSNMELWDFQPGSFALAELFFNIDMSAGGKTTDLSISYFDLDDVNGDVINVIGINNAIISVPSPAPLTLMGIALLALCCQQKYQPKSINKPK